MNLLTKYLTSLIDFIWNDHKCKILLSNDPLNGTLLPSRWTLFCEKMLSCYGRGHEVTSSRDRKSATKSWIQEQSWNFHQWIYNKDSGKTVEILTRSLEQYETLSYISWVRTKLQCHHRQGRATCPCKDHGRPVSGSGWQILQNLEVQQHHILVAVKIMQFLMLKGQIN